MAAWPPAPKVASTTLSPRCRSSSSATSAASTGTCSTADLLLRETFGNILHAPVACCLLAHPALAVPHLEVPARTGDDDILLQPRVLEQRRRQHHAALPVQLALVGAGEEPAPQHPRLTRERVEPLQARLDEGVPAAAREHEQAPVKAFGDHRALRECRAELGGEGEAVLCIKSLRELAEQHGVHLPFRPTLPHNSPRCQSSASTCSQS